MMNTAQAMSAPSHTNADLAAEHVDRRSRRDLQATVPIIVNAIRQPSDLGRLPETLLKQIRDGRDVEFPSDVGNASGKAEKINIPSRYGSAVAVTLKPLEYATPAHGPSGRCRR